MAPLFGSCRALLGQAGERTPLLLSELPFRDAKYDPIEPPSPTLTTYLSSQPSNAQKSQLWSWIPKQPCSYPPTHSATTSSGGKKERKKFASDPVTRAKPERCASLQTPLLSPLLCQTLCWWYSKPSEPGHTTQVTRLSAESVLAHSPPPSLWWTQPNT